MPTTTILIERLLMVILVGGLIGAEREFRSKSAGFRTMILICLGSFLFTTFSIMIGNSSNDRIASNIVTGIGFLGAGVIFKSDNRINGITTAATIWATAALGMGIADGAYEIVFASTAVILSALFLLTKLEIYIDRRNQSVIYKVTSPYQAALLEEYEDIFDEYNLHHKKIKSIKSGANITGFWIVQGSQANHKKFTQRMLDHPSVKEFEF
jgi:putative Mg2+ transporter-C (MgtC) family protein